MHKKMKRSFIAAAMAAFGLVMLVIIAGINLVNYYQMVKNQDEMVEGLYDFETAVNSQPSDSRPLISDMPWASGPEAEYTTRFFVVHCDEKGMVQVFGNDYISSIDRSTAEEYTGKVLDAGREKGFHGDYRYCVFREDKQLTIIFLNVRDSLKFARSLLIVSVIIGLVCLAAVFGLVILFSGYAIRPYVENALKQKQFITDAGHELKTPITSISTSADIAAMEHGGDEWIENIQRQSLRLSKLVNELIQLSRMDEEYRPQCEDFPLSEVVWELAEEFNPIAEARGLTFERIIDDDIVINGERDSIQKMVSILLDNAMKYTDERGIVRLNLEKTEKRATLSVYNTCRLAETENLDRLFDRFYRPDESRSRDTGGSGIGLSIAQAVADAHGTKIDVNSPDGGSIIFKVSFDLKRA